MTTPAPPDRSTPPLKFFTTLLHLATYGVFGFAALSIVGTLLATGIGLIPIFGIGLILLVGVIYMLFGIGWLETERVSWLYDLRIPALTRAPGGQGFKGYLRSLWRQFIDARMWRAIASFAITSVLGFITLILVQSFVRLLIAVSTRGTSSAYLFGPFEGAFSDGGVLTLGILSLIVIPALVILLTMLHRTLGVALIASGIHEAQLRDQVRVTSEQREGAIRAADVERTRIERDLHDGVQPRLVSIAMTLGLAKGQLDTDPEAAKSLIDEAHTSTKAAVTELRQLARGIHASVLDDRGLDAALSALAGRSLIPVHLDSRIGDANISREAQTAVYFAVAESLTNAAKHSFASDTRVTLRVRYDGQGGHLLWARIEDNGVGGARIVPGGGLDGIIGRITAAGGSTTLVSPEGGPTTLEVTVPCAS